MFILHLIGDDCSVKNATELPSSPIALHMIIIIR